MGTGFAFLFCRRRICSREKKFLEFAFAKNALAKIRWECMERVAKSCQCNGIGVVGIFFTIYRTICSPRFCLLFSLLLLFCFLNIRKQRKRISDLEISSRRLTPSTKSSQKVDHTDFRDRCQSGAFHENTKNNQSPFKNVFNFLPSSLNRRRIKPAKM